MDVKTNSRNLWFDLIRGFSALAVCASHLRAALFVDYDQRVHSGGGLKFFYTLTGLGHEAVMVFFVLSGYFVGGSVVGRGSSFQWGNYAEARLTRLWVVLIPALALTFGLDLITKQFAPDALQGAWHQAWNSGPSIEQPWSISSITALGNVFFLHTITVPTFGSNRPLWSLAYEFWYYALFPLLMCTIGLVGSFSKISRVGQLLALIVLLFFLPPKLLAGSLVWLLGISVFYCPKPHGKKAVILGVVSLLCFIGSLMASKGNFIQGFPSDFSVGLSFAFLAATLRGIPFPSKVWLQSCSKFLSEISYSLYVVHFPIMLSIAAIFFRGQQFEPDAHGFGIFVIWFTVLILSGSGFWWIFEKRTLLIRKRIQIFNKKLELRNAKHTHKNPI